MAGGPTDGDGLEACLLSGIDLDRYPNIVEMLSIAPTFCGIRKSDDFDGVVARMFK